MNNLLINYKKKLENLNNFCFFLAISYPYTEFLIRKLLCDKNTVKKEQRVPFIS